ncbi:MAG: histidine--tRNA ligase [Sphingomonadaceae bacterium]
MGKTIQRVRGMQDMLGAEAERFRAVIAAFDRVRRLYAFQRVEVPLLEATEVFARSIGEATDIVSKEMYSFEDKGGDSVTLRPEFTAAIARAYISNGWQQHGVMKLATHGPLFRYERPQKGRYRQFHQLDAEIVGAAEPAADVELIAFADQLLAGLGLSERIELQLNTLGDERTRRAWREALVEHFGRHRFELSEESRKRLERNPLRILDSKAHQDWPIVDSAPTVDDFLSDEAAAFFAEVTEGLDAAGIAWTRKPRLVRGLDYYRHTAFEFVTEDLGAQSAVIAGGRYDALIADLGGPQTPAVGWAAGIERLAMLIEEPPAAAPDAVIVPLGAEAERRAMAIAARLRREGLAVDMAYRGNMKKRMQKAAASGARHAVILGEDELARGEAGVKDMDSGKQRDVVLDALAEALR